MRKLMFVMLLASGAAYAGDESQIHLKDGPGKDLVQSHCSVCHSLDEIQINSPFLDKAGWTAEVSKMINVMGIPIDDNEKGQIINYLTSNYGAK